MSVSRRALAVLPLLAIVACLPEATLETDSQKASYGIGMNMGRSLAEVQEHVDMAALMKGFTDAMAESEPAIGEEELEAAMAAFNEIVEAGAAADRAAAGEKNMTEGAAFLAANVGNEGVMTTESGLQYQVLREGDGATPESGQRVTLHYRGTLPDGTEFDSSYDGDPATFGVDNVIAGFSEAVKMMQVGGHIRVTIPSDLAYGAQGSLPRIGPNQVLIFEIELLGIE